MGSSDREKQDSSMTWIYTEGILFFPSVFSFFFCFLVIYFANYSISVIVAT